MKKFKIIAIIIVILIVLLTGVVIRHTIHAQSSLRKIARSLVEIDTITDWKSNENSPIDDIVNIDNGLYRVLKNNHVSSEKIKVDSMIGDCFGDSSKFVTHSIEITSPNDTLCIRLRYDLLRSQYHIVGYSGTIK